MIRMRMMTTMTKKTTTITTKTTTTFKKNLKEKLNKKNLEITKIGRKRKIVIIKQVQLANRYIFFALTTSFTCDSDSGSDS